MHAVDWRLLFVIYGYVTVIDDIHCQKCQRCLRVLLPLLSNDVHGEISWKLH